MVHKQVVQGGSEAPSYGSILSKVNARIAMCGLVPTVFRNFILLLGIQPSKHGISNDLTTGILALGCITLSHPFEVARVHQQYHGNMSLDFRSTLQDMMARDGVAGVYRGLIPRTLHLLPAYMGWMIYNQTTKPTDKLTEFYGGYSSTKI